MEFLKKTDFYHLNMVRRMLFRPTLPKKLNMKEIPLRERMFLAESLRSSISQKRMKSITFTSGLTILKIYRMRIPK